MTNTQVTEVKKKKWNDDRAQVLKNIVGNTTPVALDTVQQAADQLDTTTKSVASKLRKMGYTVATKDKTYVSKFSVEDEADLRAFVEANAGTHTFAEIAATFKSGKYSSKSIQGKLLSMELTGSVKLAEKTEVARTYTEAEEAKFVSLAETGAYLEDIASALGKSLNSTRGKALSLFRNKTIKAIPAQRDLKAKAEDPLEALGNIKVMTVAEIANSVNKTERGIRTILTRRGINCADYEGESRKAKLAQKKSEAV